MSRLVHAMGRHRVARLLVSVMLALSFSLLTASPQTSAVTPQVAASDSVGLPEAPGKAAQTAATASLTSWTWPTDVLYDNGPLITHPGEGADYADVSALQTSLGLYTYGWSVDESSNYRLADDFTVPAGGWYIEEMTFFSYQVDSTTTSTTTAVNLRIWNDDPTDSGSAVVFGDTSTNRLLTSTWTNIYRSIDTNLGSVRRPIMANVVEVDTFLPAGHYWADFQVGGSASYDGPFCPPVTILGQTGKPAANALQGSAGAWTEVPDDVPFIIESSDRDGDGVTDDVDVCPDIAGSMPNGCPALFVAGAGDYRVGVNQHGIVDADVQVARVTDVPVVFSFNAQSSLNREGSVVTAGVLMWSQPGAVLTSTKITQVAEIACGAAAAANFGGNTVDRCVTITGIGKLLQGTKVKQVTFTATIIDSADCDQDAVGMEIDGVDLAGESAPMVLRMGAVTVKCPLGSDCTVPKR